MKIKEVKMKVIFAIVIVILLAPLISAGVGIKWDRESVLVNEEEETCLTYSVYNPWPDDSYVTIEVSEQLEAILIEQEAETKFIPANTASTEAIPVEFCFKIPEVYEDDCWLGVMCKQECLEEQKVYDGEVLVKSVQPDTGGAAGSGSATAMSVSAPLKIKINCNPSSRNLTLIYVIVAVISFIVIILLYLKYRKSKVKIAAMPQQTGQI
jgi:preprotein translocase subunit SecG